MMGTGGIAAMGVLIVLAALLCLGLLVLVGLAIVWLLRKLRTNPTTRS